MSVRPAPAGSLRERALVHALEALDREGAIPSLRGLASRCGVTHTALYRHFASQDALALDIAVVCQRQLTAAVTEAAEALSTPDRRLRAGGEGFAAWARRYPGRYRFMTSEVLAERHQHTEFLAAATESFGTLVTLVRECGVPEPIPFAHTIWVALHGLLDLTVKRRTIPVPADPFELQLARLLDLLLAPVSACDGPGHTDRATRLPPRARQRSRRQASD